MSVVTSVPGQDEKLALEGGTAAFTRPYPPPFYGADLIGDEEIAEVTRVLQSRSLFRYYGPDPQGLTELFEKEFAGTMGVEHCLGVVNGTAALRCALAALGVGPGDEVIVPAYTFIATPEAVISVGATPVFAEVDDSLCLDPLDVPHKITARTRVIIPVHLHGVAADLSPILATAAAHGLKVLEDCAQACGVHYRGRPVGSFGDIAAFSFQQNKTMATGEGGALITHSADLIRRARMFHDHGGVREGMGFPSFDEEDCFFGENLHMSEITAAVGRVQLRRLAGMLRRLKTIKERILDQVSSLNLPWRRVPDAEGEASLSLCLLLSDADVTERWVEALRAEGVPAHRYYGRAVYECKLFARPASYYEVREGRALPQAAPTGSCGRTEDLARRSLWVNLHPAMSEDDVRDLAKAIEKVTTHRGR